MLQSPQCVNEASLIVHMFYKSSVCPGSAHNAPSYRACIQLLSSLSGYQYTRRAWKKEAFDLFMDHTFFQMDSSCVSQ